MGTLQHVSVLEDRLTLDAAHILSSLTSSLIRLSLSNPESLHDESVGLVSTLIGALRSYADNHGWDLASSALRRSASMAARLTDMQEHLPLATALGGGEPAGRPEPLPSAANTNDGGVLPDPQTIFTLPDWNWDDVNLGLFA